MPIRPLRTAALLALLALLASPAAAQDAPAPFRAMDVFELEWSEDPRISPDGEQVVYVRSGFDAMDDSETSALWIVDADGARHRPLSDGTHSVSSPRWSPSGDRIAYVSAEDESSQIWVRWMDTNQITRATSLEESPSNLAWSPDGERIAFTMFVANEDESFAEMPDKPEGADWGPDIQVVTDIDYKTDGRGLLESGHRHVFVVPADGGTPRRLTSGPYDHSGTPEWTPDGERLIVSANRGEDAAYDPADSELYEIRVDDGRIRALTDRHGPDGNPAVSPDGRRVAYTGHDERYLGYQQSRLYLLDRDSGEPRELLPGFDRSVQSPVWAADGSGLFFQYDDEGSTRVDFVSLEGRRRPVAGDVGGLSLGRPYGGGAFSVSDGGRVAFTLVGPDHPADVAVARPGEEARRLTRLNQDLLEHRTLGEMEEIRYESSHDGREIHGWIVKPPDFDPSETYPLLLEIHGGPFSNYGPRFAAEIQLYAAAGYVVLYTNPRGSTSYGQEFGNLIHHAYPSQDYDDLVSGVDAVVERGYVDPDRLFVTGGSGGGVLTAWIVGKTDRFAAAVVQKPVINWYSWALYADMSVTGVRYWFPGPPWEHRDHYMDRSPISLVGDVTTPTMLVTGEEDLRTPMPDSEQYYGALKLQKVPAALVRIPDASHGIASKPSNLVAKVVHVLEWFERHPRKSEGTAAGDSR